MSGGIFVAAFALGVSLLAAGCSTSRGPMAAGSAIGSDVDDLSPASLAEAADGTARALERVDPTGIAVFGRRRVSASQLAESARKIAEIARSAPDAATVTREIARKCRAYPLQGPMKVTGYYEPLLDARRARDGRFRYPLYRAPSPEQLAAATKKLGRIPTRVDIDDDGALAGLGLELAWLDDPVARFFLHVQGSGRLRFPDGGEMRVGFGGTNELAYRSIGAVMMERGLLEPGRASATAMKRWLAAHPHEQSELLGLNPRYVFFRDTGSDGPIGSLGTTLVAGRSVAVDDRYIPPGSLAWLRTTRPVVDADGTLTAKKPVTRFVFAQDSGAAIKGPSRADLFVGSGEEAGVEAGGMNEAGEYFVLMCGPRPLPDASMSPTGGPWSLSGPGRRP